MKISKSEQIRRLLAKGTEVAAIAKRLKVEPNYVHQVKWHEKQRKLKATGKTAAKRGRPAKAETNGHATPVVHVPNGTAQLVDATFDFVDSQRMSFLLGSAITAISEGTDASLHRARALLAREIERRTNAV